MLSSDHLPQTDLKLGGVKNLSGLLLWCGEKIHCQNNTAILDITHTYFRHVNEGHYFACEDKSDMEVMFDYISLTVHQADKSIVADYYIKKVMGKPKAHHSAAHSHMVMTTFEVGAANTLVAHDSSASSKPTGEYVAVIPQLMHASHE